MKKKIIGLLTVTLVLLTVFMSSFAAYAATALKITKQPVSVSACAGGKAKVSVTAKGDGLTYSWYYKNKGQDKYTLIKSKTEKTYTVTMKDAYNGRKLYCVVKDKYGNSVKSDVVKLTLAKKVEVKKLTASVKVRTGQKVKITVDATGDGLTYSWYYKNKGQDKYTLIKSKTEKTYTVTMKKAYDGRKMYCVVKDKYGNKVKTEVVKFAVGKTVTITKQPVSTVVKKGNTAVVTLEATGDGLSYNWYSKNKGDSKFSLITTKKDKTYTLTMKDAYNGRQLYCIVKDKYGSSVKSDVVTLYMGNVAQITKQPLSAESKCGSQAKVSLTAKGDGLSYTWYYKNKGQSKFSLVVGKKEKTYTLTMKEAYDGRQLYCVVKDKYGNSVRSDVVTLYSVHSYGKGVVTKEASCKTKGEKVYTCYCGYKKTEVIPKTNHTFDSWKVMNAATVNTEGYERSYCKVCGYYKDRTIAKLPAKYYITAVIDEGKNEKVAVAKDGIYSLETPVKVGYNFIGWKTSANEDFAASGKITADTTVTAQWVLDGTDSFEELYERVNAGVDKILITADITVTDALYVWSDSKIYSDGDYSIKRASDYAGDIFVVGKNNSGKTSTSMGKNAILNLGGGNGTLTIDGNRDNLETTVVGSALFVSYSSVVNIYDGTSIINHKKLGNERYQKLCLESNIPVVETPGGAAILIKAATVNMYGGLIANNAVATEYTVIVNEDNTTTNAENNGCGGAVYNKGNFNMYGGKITGNEALRGGGVYSASYAYLDAGEISDNISHTYGGAVSSSSSSYADIHLGTDSGDKALLIKNNHSMKAGGALYSSTSSPIIIYGNVEFIGNHSDSSGGAIYTAGPLTIKNTLFKENYCTNSGGAIYNHYTKETVDRRQFNVSDSEFIGNSAGLGGAVILSASDAVAETNMGTIATITNCTFTKNQAIKSDTTAGNGGAIYATRKSEATITGCSFTENTAGGNAGALAVLSSSKVQIAQCNFENNSGVLGGAMYTSSKSVVGMSDTVFKDNKAVTKDGLGGGMYVSSANLTLSNVDFFGNNAQANGGAILQKNMQLNIDSSCEFNGNSAGGHGGAFYLTYDTIDGVKEGAVLNADGVTFQNNTANAGGAVSVRSASSANLVNVNLINNVATGTGVDAMGGGAVYVGYGELSLTNVTATGNTSADFGGVVNSIGSDVTVTGGEYTGNSALNGGAFSAAKTSNLAFTETKINSNESTYVQVSPLDSSLGGGAVNISGGSLTLNAVTFEDNKSNYYGGTVLASKTQVTVENSTVSGSSGKTGAALYFKNACTVEISDSFVTNNTSNGNGVVYVNGGTLDAANLTATGNKASNGGVIYASGSSTVVNIKDSTWTENTSTTSGGVGYVAKATFGLNNCKIGANSSKTGGAFCIDSAQVNIANSEFTLNSSTANGGAIYTNNTANVTVADVSFIGNSAGGHGGAIDTAGATVTVSGTTSFTSNTAKNHGGAVYVVYFDPDTEGAERLFSSFNMTGGTFENNSALGGGAVSVRTGCEATLTDTALKGNTTEGYASSNDGDGEGGGAVYVGYGKLNLNNVTATGNQAKATSWTDTGGKEKVYSFGGVVDALSAEVNINGGTFTGNKAATGGAIYAKKTTVTVTGGSFSENASTYVHSDYDNACGGGALATVNGTLTIDGTKLNANGSNYYGGAIHASGTIATIKNAEISNHSSGTGAALYFKSSCQVTISDTSITDNTSTANGVVYLSSGKTEMTNVTATGNKASKGGVLYVSGSSTVVNLKESTWSNNTATSNGGAGYVSDATFNVSDCQISENTAKYGGAFYYDNAKGEISKSTFTSNSASSNGGAIYLNGESAIVKLTESTFTQNTASSNGGAVFVNSSAQLTVTDTSFNGNSAGGHGGAVDTAGAAVTVSGTTSFTSNTAKNHGGAVYVVYFDPEEEDAERLYGSFTMTGGTFENNSALGGGAVSVRTGCEATLTDTALTGNTTEGYASSNDGDGEGGGAVYVGYGTLILNNVTVKGNNAKATSWTDTGGKERLYSFGGAIDGVSAEVNINGGTFTENKAAIGGAIYARSKSTVTVKNATFTNNESDFDAETPNYVNTAGGGAINISGGTLTVSASTFDGNKSGYYGGTILTNGATTTIEENTVIKNSAGATGAAMSSIGSGTVTVKNSSVERNTGTGSGVVYVSGPAMSLESVTFKENKGSNGIIYVSGSSKLTCEKSEFTSNTVTGNGGAIDWRSSGTANITSTSFTGNSAKKGGAISASGKGPMTITSCTFKNNTANSAGAVYADLGASVTVSGGSFDTNSATSGDAGAIMVADSSDDGTNATKVELSNVSFTGNTSSSKGGALSTDTASPNLIISAENCIFTSNKSTAGGGAVEITNANQPDATDPTELTIVFKNCQFISNTAGTTGGAAEIRSASAAKFDGITSTGNSCTGKGATVYVTSDKSRVYLTGEVTYSNNTSKGGTLVHLYATKNYTNPPALYTTHSSDAEWNTTEFIAGESGFTPVVHFGLTQLP